MQLISGETTVQGVAIDHLTLTTHRIRYDRREAGMTKVVGITLDAVSSCGVISKSYPILLLCAAASFLLGILFLFQGAEEKSIRNGAFLFALIFVVAFLLTREVALRVASAGESITVAAKHVKPDLLLQFVDAVEQEKLNYLEKLHSQRALTT